MIQCAYTILDGLLEQAEAVAIEDYISMKETGFL